MARGDERKRLHLINQLRSCQDAAAGMVVPFLLHDIWMTIPIHIAAIWIDITKCPGALQVVLYIWLTYSHSYPPEFAATEHK
jgi:hypothetical protein